MSCFSIAPLPHLCAMVHVRHGRWSYMAGEPSCSSNCPGPKTYCCFSNLGNLVRTVTPYHSAERLGDSVRHVHVSQAWTRSALAYLGAIQPIMRRGRELRPH